MCSDVDRIVTTKRAINLLPSPHIMQLELSTSQTRDLRKRKGFIGCAVCSVDDEDMCSLGRLARVILWWRSAWCIGSGVERGSWNTYIRVLVERQKFWISDDSDLVR